MSERAKDTIVANGLKPCAIYPAEEIPFDVSESERQQRLNDVERLVRRGMPREEAVATVRELFYYLDENFERPPRRKRKQTSGILGQPGTE
jgi:hypothetical protein